MKHLLPFAPLVLLGGCISFGAEPPPSLLTLSSVATVEAGATRSSASAATIAVTKPEAPQEIAVTRVPVRSGDTRVAYVKDAVWVDVPSQLFVQLLRDAIAARTGRVVVDPVGAMAPPAARLAGELRNFGIEETAMEAVVTYDAALLRGSGGAVEKRRFEARVPVAAIDANSVGPALNQAANQVAQQVADWVGGG